MIKYYRELNDEEKRIAIERLAVRIKTSKEIMLSVLLKMNPLLAIKGGKVVIYRNTFTRLNNKIREYVT
ncbi:hypothetical protein GCM10022393_37400 [Aquimarina addita]|uniref:Uncharacterized protein n=1 Tax=Aquimarina addita TaxID=870485 RepID=A0ABP6UUS9_9FLAO